MRVRFKGKDPRAGHEIDLDPASAKRYIKDGVAEEVTEDEAAAASGNAEAATADTVVRSPAAKKSGRSR